MNINRRPLNINSSEIASLYSVLDVAPNTMETLMMIRPELRDSLYNLALYYNSLEDKPTNKIKINSGWRSLAAHASLYKNRAANPNEVAPPSKYASHYMGLAFDIDPEVADFLDENGILSEFGLMRPSPYNDPVHIESEKWGFLSPDKKYAEFGGNKNYSLLSQGNNLYLEPWLLNSIKPVEYLRLIGTLDPDALKNTRGISSSIIPHLTNEDRMSGEPIGDSTKISGARDIPELGNKTVIKNLNKIRQNYSKV